VSIRGIDISQKKNTKNKRGKEERERKKKLQGLKIRKSESMRRRTMEHVQPEPLRRPEYLFSKVGGDGEGEARRKEYRHNRERHSERYSY